MKPKPGQMIKLKNVGCHGDWKTVSVRPDIWPSIPAGTEVEFIKEWWNFYGTQWRVRGPNGHEYDIEPKDFERE